VKRKVIIKLLGVFRQKTGTGNIELKFDKPDLGVLDILEGVNRAFPEKEMQLTTAGEITAGVLLFLENDLGAAGRVLRVSEKLTFPKGKSVLYLILTAGMEGG
jgi:hypothetical protein